jgi:hypothetical protein
MSVATAQTGDGGLAVSARPYDALRTWLPFALILAAAIAERHFVGANTDVSWEITLSEKILDGQRLYVDLIELNPPASTFLYLPAVALARALGLAPEIAVDALVLTGALISLVIAGDIVRRYRLLDGPQSRVAAALALAALTILPAQTFGEREHIALIAVLPALALLVARADGVRPLLWHCLVAGAGAGVTICIKPHFALAIACAAGFCALHRRSWRRLLVLENWIAAAIAVAYGISVVVFYPAFLTDVMPLVADVYLPVRLSLAQSLLDTPVMLWTAAVLMILALRRGTGFHPVFAVMLTAAAGFAAAYVLQGKGWPYQSYPMLALAMIALGLAIARRRQAMERTGEGYRFKDICAVLAFCFIAAKSFAWLDIAVEDRAATAIVERIAPPHPSITLISDDVALGHPLVRAVQGRWISRVGSLWIMEDAAIQRFAGGIDAAKDRRLAAYMEAGRQQLIGEIRDGKPDIILIDDRADHIVVDKHGASWSEWVNADRDLSALLAADYRAVGKADGLAIFKRDGR